MNQLVRFIRIIAVSLVLVSLGGCQPNVYGSIGVSSFGGYHGGPGMRGSISVGGRICC